MPIPRPIFATLTLVVLPFLGLDSLSAQQGPPFDPPGPPPLPPGLHDRTLPPGKPFDGGDFEPPGRRGNFQPPGWGGGGPSGLSFQAQVNAAADAVVQGLNAGSFEPGSESAADAARAIVRNLDAVPADPQGLARAVTAFNELVLESSDTFLQEPPSEFLAMHEILVELVTYAETSRSPVVEGESGPDPLRAGYLVDVPEWTAFEATASYWTHPGMGASNPSGYGAEFGTVWVGASYQPRARHSNGQTGAAAFGLGLGDAQRYAGLQIGVNSFSTVSSGFFRRTAVDLHLHRMLPGDIGVAVGWESALTFGTGDVTRDSGSNRYAVASRWFSLRSDPGQAMSSAVLSVGVGDGRFKSERHFLDGRSGVGMFGSAAVRVAPPASLIAEWTGQDLMLATSVTPLRDQRFAITAGVADVTGAAGDGARFVIGASAGHDFRRD